MVRPALLALLVGQVVSTTGALMTALAIPWLVLTTSDSPARASMVVAAELVPALFFGIPSGAVVARLGARLTMLIADLLWTLLVGLIPVLFTVKLLTFPVLLAIGLLVGTLYTPYEAAKVVVLPQLVGEQEVVLAQANAIFLSADRITYFLGPALGGVLIGAIGAQTVLAIDAASYFVSFLLIAVFMPTLDRHPERQERHRLFAGVRVLAGDRLLRAWSIAQTGSQTSFQALAIALPIFAFLRPGHDPRLAGALLAAWGGGALLGGVTAYPAVRRWQSLQLGRIAWLVYAAPLWLLAAPLAPVALLVTLAVSGFGNGLRNPPVRAFITLRIPPPLRPQAMTAISTITTAGSLLALALIGAAIQLWGLTSVFVAIASISTGSAVLFATATIHVRTQANSSEEHTTTASPPTP